MKDGVQTQSTVKCDKKEDIHEESTMRKEDEVGQWSFTLTSIGSLNLQVKAIRAKEKMVCQPKVLKCVTKMKMYTMKVL